MESSVKQEHNFWPVNKTEVKYLSYKQQPGAPQVSRLIETQFSRSILKICEANFRSFIESVVSKSKISLGMNSIGQGHEFSLSLSNCRQIIAKTEKSRERPNRSTCSKLSSRSPSFLITQKGPWHSRPVNDMLLKYFLDLN